MARSIRLPKLPGRFNSKHALSRNFLTRSRKFKPQNLFFSLVHLVSSTNKDGYHCALQKSWQQLKLSTYATPVKSSLSEFRNKVSYEFFAEIFQSDLKRLKSDRKTFRDHHIYAVDGSDLDLPASESIVEEGYRGSLWSKEFETHYPKMYVVHAYDVLNQLVVGFNQSTRNAERALSESLIENFERKSITIYDRLYAAQPVFERHLKAGNYFLSRTTSTGGRVATCIQKFLASGLCDSNGVWKAKHQSGPGIQVRLIKVRHPRTGTQDVFVTNVPKELFSRLELQELYGKRWSIEGSYRDIISTLKLDQWHSRNINGILQEIFTLLWLVNAVKSQLHCWKDPEEKIFASEYRQSNFKLAVRLVVDNFHMLHRRRNNLIELLEAWFYRTRERRTHYSRSYLRAVRSYGTGFGVISKVPRRK